jgi:hypothetical protein
VAIALHAVVAWLSREVGLLVTQDDARYILLARSIRSLGYRDLYSVDLPIHSLYPPGYAALLAVWGAVFGEGFSTYIALSVILSAASLWLIFLALRRLESTEFATLCVLALSTNSLLILRAGSVRSEVPFMFLVAAFAWAVASERISGRYLTVAAVAAIAAALTRSLGAALPLALFAHLLLERRYRALLVFGGAALVTGGLWHGWTLIADQPSTVSGYFQAAVGPAQDTPSFLQVLINRIVRNLTRYLTALPGQLFPTIPGTPLDNGAALLVWTAGLAIGGWSLRRRWRPVVLILLISALVLAIWPFNRSRFVEPYLPLIVPCVLLGVGLLAGRWRASLKRPVMYAVGGIFVLTGVIQSGVLPRSTLRAQVASRACGEFSLSNPPACIPEDTRSFLQAVDYVNRRAPEDALFVSAKSEPLFYYTGRQSISYSVVRGTSPSTDFAALLRELGVDYVLLGAVHVTEPQLLASRLETACDQLSVEEFFPPRTYLFRVRESPEPEPEGGACEGLEDYRETIADSDLMRRLELER